MKHYDVQVYSSVKNPYKPDEPICTKFDSVNHRTLCKVFLYVDGEDIDFVSSVTYEFSPDLHQYYHSEGIVEENKIISTRGPKNRLCRGIIWTSHLFSFYTRIETVGENVMLIKHRLNWEEELRRALY